MAKIDINAVADYIIWRSREAGDSITNLKLQKLLYYVQAWRLALEDEPLFDESFKAWVHGPVNLTVYHRFKPLRWSPIEENINEPPLSEDIKTHINDVLEVYSDLSAYQLELLTHREAPWIEARKELAPEDVGREDIKNELMRDYYKNLLDKHNAETK